MVKATGVGEGSVRLVLDETEAGILRRLIEEMRLLLGEAAPRAKKSKSDEVVDRLFPAAYETADEEAEYRRLVGGDLLAFKLDALTRIESALGPRGGTEVNLTAADVEPWLTTLTDLRLAIGTRLAITEDLMAEEVDPSDPNAASLSVLHWLGWLQEQLLSAHAGAA